MSESPIIEAPWIVAMIVCGSLGFIIHVILIIITSRHYFLASYDSLKAKIFISACLTLLLFNTIACLLWFLFRTNIMIDLTIFRCKLIYSLNFLCYFMGKYILHCLLIFRIYITFKQSALSLSRTKMFLFIGIISINFFIAMIIWIISIYPHVLKGIWNINNDQHEICTLFSENDNQNLWVKLSAITVGIEDFIVGSITLIVFLNRFRMITKNGNDIYLVQSSFRFAVSAIFSVISTLFLFTFAIPFYPNLTFILAIDATINSICLFCVLAVGETLYQYLCFPCWLLGNRWINTKQNNPSASKRELMTKVFTTAGGTGHNNNTVPTNRNQIVITGSRPNTIIITSNKINNKNTNNNNINQAKLSPQLNSASIIFADPIKNTTPRDVELSWHLVQHDGNSNQSDFPLPQLKEVRSAPIPHHLIKQPKINLSKVNETQEV